MIMANYLRETKLCEKFDEEQKKTGQFPCFFFSEEQEDKVSH